MLPVRPLPAAPRRLTNGGCPRLQGSSKSSPAGGRAMAAGQEMEISEAQIAVHWREEEYYPAPAKFIGQANATDPAIFERFSEEHFPECFKEYADLLDWDAYWHTTLDTSRNKAALIWVPEPEDEDTTAITYQELHKRVNEFAALLQGFTGVQAGDR